MNWKAYFQAAMEELDAFLADPANAEWYDTMYSRVAEEIITTIALCSEVKYQVDVQVELMRKCNEKARVHE
jgi:hypothetical protein